MVKPGLYVVSGESTKNLSLIDPQAWFGLEGFNADTNPSLQTLKRDVEWVFIALNKRWQQFEQTPHAWMQGDSEIKIAPFGLDIFTLARIDEALQLYGKAYLHKKRSRVRMLDVGWIDPTTVKPDDTADYSIYDGWTQYISEGSDPAGRAFRRVIPASDLIKFERLGTGELQIGVSAATATRLAAGILKGINSTADTTFDNNGLGVWLIRVPQYVSSDDKQRLRDRFYRLFNRNTGTSEHQTMAVPDGVEAERLSLAPSDLAMTELSEPRITAVLAAHDVPRSIVFDDASNFATQQGSRQGFALTIAHRLAYIAKTINSDPHVAQAGLTLDVRTKELTVNLEEEERRVNMLTSLLDRRVEPQQAALIVGLDLPEGETLQIAAPEPVPAALQQDEPTDAPDERREAEVRALRRFVSAGKHLKRQFHSDILTLEEVEIYTAQFTGASEDSFFYP